MKCLNDQEELEKILFNNVEVDFCPKCLGMWFDEDELRMVKDNKDKSLNWLDIDLWRDRSRFEVFHTNRYCPDCRVGLSEIKYDESKIKIDFCKKCQGVWLDRGEFKQIMNYLKQKSDYEILNHYSKNLLLELGEVFSGPETLREEINDFFTLLNLFKYKFAIQRPFLSALIDGLPK